MDVWSCVTRWMRLKRPSRVQDMYVLHVSIYLESAQEYKAGINLLPTGHSTGHHKRR